MPIHEYRCRSCEHRFEHFAVGRDDEPSCPRCEGRDLERALSSFRGRRGQATAAPAPRGGGGAPT